MGILMKVLFVAVIAITIIAFVWKEATSVLPAKVVTYIRVGGVLLTIILGTLCCNMDFGNILSEILRTTATSFDFAFVICVNVLAYLVIKLVDKLNGNKVVSTWNKRVITLVCALIMGVIYFSLKLGDVKVVLNSIILSFVFWSWIMKPILAFFNIDYRKFIELEDNEPNQYPK